MLCDDTDDSCDRGLKDILPEQNTKGPKARASAPIDRNIPIIFPFWSLVPSQQKHSLIVWLQ